MRGGLAVKHDSSARKPTHCNPGPGRVARRQILAVEPDPLTQWSLKMYLSKWFDVYATGSIVDAQHVLENHAVDVLIVSEELPPTALASLETHAHNFNACVEVIRTVADPSKPRKCIPHVTYLEKPFELAHLAQMLGVPPEQLPRDEP